MENLKGVPPRPRKCHGGSPLIKFLIAVAGQFLIACHGQTELLVSRRLGIFFWFIFFTSDSLKGFRLENVFSPEGTP